MLLTKRIAFNLLLAAASLVIFLAALEGSGRLYKSARHVLDEYEQFYEEQGLRTDNKKPGEKRLFIIGESAARGVPYTLENSLTGYLQKALDLSGNSHIRVVSAAIPGKHSFWQRHQAPALLRYGADAVMIYAGNNDTRDFSNVWRDVPFAGFDFELSHRSAFYDGLKRKLFALREIMNKRSGKQIFNENHNPDDVNHWQDVYLLKKREYLNNPELGMRRKIMALHDYEKNLGILMNDLKRRGVKLFIADLPIVHRAVPMISDWSRKGYEFQQRVIFDSPEDESRWKELYDLGEEHLKAGRFEEAVNAFDQAWSINPTYPMLAHHLAEAHRSLGRFEEARQFYLLDKDLQVQSAGGDPSKSAVLRRLGMRYGAVWVDFQAALEEASVNGIVGPDLFLDHCHANTLGHKVLAARTMQSLCSSGFAQCGEGPQDWRKWYEMIFQQKPDAANNAREHLLTAFYLFKGSAWSPQPDYKAAAEYLEMARAIMPDNKDIYPMLAASYWQTGEKEKSRASLEILEKLDSAEYQKTLSDFPYLKEFS